MRGAGERTLSTYPYSPGHVAGSETSKAAADSITPKALGHLHRLVWSLLHKSGGMTDEELIEAIGRSASTVRPRRIELVEQGFVEDSGHTKHTRSGRSATIWRVTGKGLNNAR